MKREAFIEMMMPWAGIVAAAVGWSLAHQIGSNSVFDACADTGAVFILLVNLPFALLAVAGGIFSWRVWRRGEDETEGRNFLGLVGTLFAALLLFAILLQTVAGFIIPRCQL